MRINYIIIIHKSPKQVKRLIASLVGRETSFYLHIDLKADANAFKEELKNIPNIFYVPDEKRCAGQWGGFELVEATLNALALIPKNGPSYNVLMSGQDYPIKSAEYIDNYLTKHYGSEFIDIFPMPSKNWWPAPYGLDRLNKYIFRKSTSRYDFVLFPSLLEKEFYKPFFIKEFVKLLLRGHLKFALKLFKKRRFPTYLNPYGGHQWWALTAETIQLVLGFLEQHPDYITYHRDSLVPDEIFFQSVLKHVLAATTPIYPCLTYANWTRKIEVLPVTFTLEDIVEIKEQPASILYARKFDIDQDEHILEAIDAQLRGS